MNQYRFKDVLIALGVAHSHQVRLKRIQLQKLVYLNDLLVGVWRYFAKPQRFRPYKNGPYDARIQNSVDALVFRGFAKVDKFQIQGAKKSRSTYQISDAGLRCLDEILKEPVLREEYSVVQEIGMEVQRRGWDSIVDIVYSDPTYQSARARNDFRTLSTGSDARNQTQLLADLFREAWEANDRIAPSNRAFIQVMFLVFDENRSESNLRAVL